MSDQGAACVAACYRCLMSYYNQPDHEHLDRRDEDARVLLLRLARARTVVRADQPTEESHPVDGEDSRDGRWLAEAVRRGIRSRIRSRSRQAVGPCAGLGAGTPYVAAVVGEADVPVLEAMDDLGFAVIRFEDPTGWNASFARLAAALGRGP